MVNFLPPPRYLSGRNKNTCNRTHSSNSARLDFSATATLDSSWRTRSLESSVIRGVGPLLYGMIWVSSPSSGEVEPIPGRALYFLGNGCALDKHRKFLSSKIYFLISPQGSITALLIFLFSFLI